MQLVAANYSIYKKIETLSFAMRARVVCGLELNSVLAVCATVVVFHHHFVGFACGMFHAVQRYSIYSSI